MARLPRLAVAGQHHLVLLRGLDHQPIVIDDEDRRRCLECLREAAAQHQVLIHAHALLDDRLRLLVTPSTPQALGRMVQSLGRRYVGGFNRRHGRRGTLWDGRFRATVVQPGPQALQALLFVDTEPVRAGLVEHAADFRWSSAAHHVGRHRDPLLSRLIDHWQLGNTPFERESAYARRLEEGLATRDALRLADANHKGWALGDAAFLAQLAAQAARPTAPRRRGRPSMAIG
ncbi:MAG: transposase [Ideonella sp.]|nr:transposase [Ideonella sp.]